MKYILSVLTLFLLNFTAFSQGFEWSNNCTKAYEKIFQFEFDEAKRLINNEPESNLVPLLLENYIDFFVLLLEENKQGLSDFTRKNDIRLTKVASGEESAYKRYIQAEINLQSGFLKLSQEEYMSGFWDVRRAYKLYEENAAQYPNFGPNKKGLGVLQMLIGTIPEKYQWGVKIVGLSGDLEKGARLMEDFIYRHEVHPIQEEAKMLYAFVKYFVEADEATAKRLVFEEINPKKGMWQTMTVANLANAMGENDFAIETLENCPSSASSFPFPTIDLMLGICKLNRLDKDADIYLKKFMEISKSPSYKKEAYQKLAWYNLVNGNETGYSNYMQQILSVGDKDMDEDKQALQEAKQGFIPNVNLLKARLLFDGGYFVQALDAINSVNPMLLEQEKEQVEYNYRLGRIYQRLERYEEAIEIFNGIVASEPLMTPYYFAPKCLMELGGIYEGRSEFVLANTLYQKVDSYTNHPYVDSFAQQSKAAMKRIKGNL